MFDDFVGLALKGLIITYYSMFNLKVDRSPVTMLNF